MTKPLIYYKLPFQQNFGADNSLYTYLNKYSIQCVVFYLQLIQLTDSTHKMNLLNSNEPCKKDGGIVKIANIIIRQAGGNIAVR